VYVVVLEKCVYVTLFGAARFHARVVEHVDELIQHLSTGHRLGGALCLPPFHHQLNGGWLLYACAPSQALYFLSLSYGIFLSC